MAGSAKIYGLERVMKRFQKELQDFAGEGTIVTGTVGYKAPHALIVHENMEVDHPVHLDGSGSTRDCGGQAKFLEAPARKMLGSIGRDLSKLKQQKKGLKTSIRIVCERLFAASQKLVPVLSGKLKRSGYVSVVARSGSTGRFK